MANEILLDLYSSGPPGDIPDVDYRAYNRDSLIASIDTVANFRLKDWEQQKYVLIAATGAIYVYQPASAEADDGVTYVHDSQSRVYMRSTIDVVFESAQFSGGTGDQGTVSWNTDEETLDLIQNGAVLQVGQEVQIHCRNNTGSAIADGTPVMATGTLGASGRITIAPMDGTSAANAKYMLGIATEDIANGTDGKVTAFGKIRQIDTTDTARFTGTIADGDVLYVDPANVGKLTNATPASGELTMPVAFVIHAASNGTLFVRVTPIDESYASIWAAIAALDARVTTLEGA